MALRSALPDPDPDLITALAERLAQVTELIRAAALRAGTAPVSPIPPRGSRAEAAPAAAEAAPAGDELPPPVAGRTRCRASRRRRSRPASAAAEDEPMPPPPVAGRRAPGRPGLRPSVRARVARA